MKATVLGAGSWGTTLSQLLTENGCETTLWARDEKFAEILRQTRCNTCYLPELKLSSELQITADLTEAMRKAEVVFVVVPTHGIEELCRNLEKTPDLQGKIYVSCAKGFIADKCQRVSEALQSNLKPAHLAVLSGPNHAEEIARKQPAGSVLATGNEELASTLQSILNNHYFRTYTSTDLVGVEIAGAVKNVIALAAGILAGLGCGDNSEAALMTRGLAEITRFGLAFGARPETFAGLAGMGDLIATCSSVHSRNRRAGLLLAGGKTVADLRKESKMAIEGINAARCTVTLAQKAGVEMPITEAVCRVLFENASPKAEMDVLMRREPKSERIF